MGLNRNWGHTGYRNGTGMLRYDVSLTGSELNGLSGEWKKVWFVCLVCKTRADGKRKLGRVFIQRTRPLVLFQRAT